ncbi:O-antigen ligase family protein [Nocardioides sp.]|uniref:O-antigen ligase family protein n=1 Tax=Nocardioides sp. TaxID=35761 RepID=UPI00356636D5
MVNETRGEMVRRRADLARRSGTSMERRPTSDLALPVHSSGPTGIARMRWPDRVPAWLTFVLPLLAAIPIGLGAGYLPVLTAAAVFGGVILIALMVRIEWAVLTVVAAAAFDDYLLGLDPRLAKGLAALAIGAWLLRRSAGPLHRKPYSPVMMTALAFVVVLLASTVAHANGTTGQAVLIRYAGFLALLVVLADTMRGGILAPATVARAYVFSSAVASLFGIGSYLLGYDRRVGGPIGDPNDFAFFLLTALPLAIALRKQGPRSRRTWPYDLSAFVITLAIVGTLSRGAMLAMAAMALFAVVVGMVRLRAALVGVVVLAAGLGITMAAVPEMVATSLQQKDYVAGQNVSERLDLWTAAGQMTVENPLLGLGPGSFALYHRDYLGALPADVNHRLDVAHNTYLEVSSELGFLGLGMFLLLLLMAFGGAWSGWRRTRDPVAAAVCAALVGAVISATFVTEQYALPFWLLAAFGAAFWVSEPERPE